MPAGVRQPSLPAAIKPTNPSPETISKPAETGLRTAVRLFVVTAALSFLFAGLIGVIRARAYDEGNLRTFFEAEGCSMPCWYGIRPGVTPVDEAMRMLEAIPWIQSPLDVVMASGSLYGDTGFVRWRWNRNFPLASDTLVPPLGMLIVEEGVVHQIYLTTYLQMGDVWLTLGKPEGGTVDFVKESGAPMLVLNNAVYLDGALLVMSYTGCPMRRSDVWRSPTFIWMRRSDAGLHFDRYPVYYPRMLQWLRDGNREYC
jgi:hypothetical protein